MSNNTQSSIKENFSYKEKFRGLLFPFYVARRYLFSKKSHNAVNVISAISSVGIGLGAMAMVCVMSVFNGIEHLIGDMFSAFDPDLKITAVQGKTFRIDSEDFTILREMSSVAVFTEVIEENALISFKDKHIPATVKGVNENDFRAMTHIDSILYDGEFILYDGGFERIVVGIGVAGSLGLGAYFLDPVYLYAPKRTSRINTLRPENSFNRVPTFVSGIFMVQQLEYDENYVLISLNRARELFEYDEETVSALELKLTDDSNHEQVKKDIQNLLGKGYSVKDRYEQQESFFRIMKMEKWMTYLILSFILLIASFNIIGSLSMLIIDKKEDIETLRKLGAANSLIKRIFLFEGWLISLVGALGGILTGTLLCILQQHFGFLKMGNSSITEAYPVITNFTDVVIVLLTVILMGFIAAWYPVKYVSIKKELSDN